MSRYLHKHDFLIIGSGIGGLSLSIKLAEIGHVMLITKGEVQEANTAYAQGGIAAVLRAPDSFEKHIQDTIVAGDFLNDIAATKQVIHGAPHAIEDLVQLAVDFDLAPGGAYDLSMEGGHSHKRILHHHDITGLEIERKLYARAKKTNKIKILSHHCALDLITTESINEKGHKCCGCYALNRRTGEVEIFLAHKTVLATGGLGQVYKYTTNPSVATGDGIAIAYRAHARLRNLEFIQFHPTALYSLNTNPSFLISETLRGKGAILRRMNGEPFMHLYDPRLELAPRDVVARAIENEIKSSGAEYVYLDARKIDKATIQAVFPNIYKRCLEAGIDLTKDMIPVIPAAHYSCGGILVNKAGHTSLENLYSLGECSSTGLHGSNRLGSNALLEALVFAKAIYEDVKHGFKATGEEITCTQEERSALEKLYEGGGELSKEEQERINDILTEMQEVMFKHVSLVRSTKGLEEARRHIKLMMKEIEDLYASRKIHFQLCELRNALTTCSLIIESALQRLESRGVHFNVDYPNKLDKPADTVL